MNAKIGAYQQAAKMKMDYRSQEAHLFKRITYALQQGKARSGGMDLVRAASDNKLLWMGVINAVSDDANQLPPALRKQLVSIGRAVIKEIDDNITGSLDVDFLIEVNNQIIEGLMSTGVPAAQPAKATP